MKLRIRPRAGKPVVTLPLPFGLAGAALALAPGAAFERAAKEIPPPYNVLVTKKTISLLYEAFRDIHKSYKGLEIPHVETRDGALISFQL